MNLEIELDRETDGRWIAEIGDLNLLLYGATREEAIERIEAAATEIIDDRIKRGTLPTASADECGTRSTFW
jgi:predicted RNase H-like HicB family nuclease